jgi:hypothetical protein
MADKKIVLTLNQVEKEWLYEVLADLLDTNASGTWDSNMAETIADRLDQAKLSK